MLFVVGRELSYARNEVLLNAFSRFAAVDVVADFAPSRSLLMASARIALRTLRRLSGQRYDLYFVGFYGYLILQALRIADIRPVLFDAFVSNYDTLCFDRKRFSSRSLAGRLAFLLDQDSCQRADQVLLDTGEHVNYFVETFRLPRTKFDVLPVGCNEAIYFPRLQKPAADGVVSVLAYSTYMPLHGMDVIVEAAAQLREAPIRFRLIGRGMEYARVRALATTLGLENISFVAPVPAVQLAHEIGAADICLGGHFGAGGKSLRVIPGKIYQMMAMRKAVIAADSPANQTLLEQGVSAMMTPPADPQALAGAILTLAQTPELRRDLALHVRAAYDQRCSERVITARLHKIADDMVA